MTNVRFKGRPAVAKAPRNEHRKSSTLQEQHDICSRTAEALTVMRGRYPLPRPLPHQHATLHAPHCSSLIGCGTCFMI